MKSSLSKLTASLLLGSLFAVAIFSCQKAPYEIGFDLLPPSDTLNVKTTDTCTVEAFSVRQDSVRTDKTSTLVMGSMMDPFFGKTTTGFYTQVRLSSEAVDFGTNPVLDSLVLMLVYAGSYGTTGVQQNVKVYEISEDFAYDSLRFSNQQLATYPTLLADQDFKPNLKDSVLVYKEKVVPHLRINLSKQTNYLGRKILEAPTDALATNSAFIKFMKGLYVTAGPEKDGALLDFSISSGISKLVVYFHNGDDPLNDSLHYNMLLNENCARFVHVDHNGYRDASPELKEQILSHDSAKGINKLFIQGLGGVKVKLKFPYIKGLGKGKAIAINDAVLQLKNLQTDTTLAPPLSLTIIRQDSAGRIGYLVDDNEGSSYFGGTYDKANHSYFFRLTQHMQNILQNAYKNHYDLYMLVNTPVSSFVKPNRIMIYGTNPLVPGDDSNPLHLKMTYTILN
ncbi:MAG: DUF4270 domain-containing protein [Bacteroidetes bacterium]|nr:DUF4270 domain-containing protein [Bacteroidota bacterium]